ncbi:hypothetical protein WJX72_010331 [[Myrmecia] bisecta]|uniref:Histidine-containing phosphotransfer protein n=1 Tax=[Myrmecia] bisecta TaxID=41462 RepID=A0AAW1PV58_9CHLO
MQLQDESNPDFVQEVVELYFEDSASKLEKLDGKLCEAIPDFNELREACQAGDRAGCQGLLMQIKENFQLLKAKLEIFMQLETQRKQLGANS